MDINCQKIFGHLNNAKEYVEIDFDDNARIDQLIIWLC
jgi:hypothetical protein